MIPTMAPPRSTSAAPVVPEPLQPLVKQLAELNEGERDLVIRAANSQAKRHKHRTMSWETIERATDLVSWGGNADEDCKALYDG